MLREMNLERKLRDLDSFVERVEVTLGLETELEGFEDVDGDFEGWRTDPKSASAGFVSKETVK